MKPISFKVTKRLEEKLVAVRGTNNPIHHKNLSMLISTICRHHGHPIARGEETCYCQVGVPVSQ